MTVNFLSGLVGIAVGGIYLITALLLPDMTMGDRLGPKLFPTIVGVAAVIAGIALCVQDKRPGKASKRADFGFVAQKDVWLKILLTTVVGIVYGLVMDLVGFLVPTVFFMLFVSMLINKGRHLQNVLIAVVFAVSCYVLFAGALKLSLPRGFLEALLPF